MKILGIIDLFAALMLVGIAYRIEIPKEPLIVVVIFLIIKSLFGLLSLAGLIDMGAAVLLIMTNFFMPPFAILLVAALLIGQKGLFSMLLME